MVDMINGLQSWEQWQELDKGQQDFEIYRLLNSLDSRLKKLEKRPIWDKSLVFVGGILGGAVTILTYFRFIQ